MQLVPFTVCRPPARQRVSGVPRKQEPASTRPPKAPEPSRAAGGARTRPGGARPLCESKKSQSAERSGAAAVDAAKARRGGPGPQRGDGTDPGARRRASATCADALQRRTEEATTGDASRAAPSAGLSAGHPVVELTRVKDRGKLALMQLALALWPRGTRRRRPRRRRRSRSSSALTQRLAETSLWEDGVVTITTPP